MKDLTIGLENRPGALAEMGEALGRAGVSVEGGGPSSSTAAASLTSSSRMGPRLAGRWRRQASESWRSGTCSSSD